MDFNMYMPVKVISGKNCIENNTEIFGEFGNRCLIITGKSSAKKCGALNDVILALKKSNTKYEIFDRIGENPLLSSCSEAGKYCAENHIDFIVAIGGGSPLDASKATAIFATNRHFKNDEDIYTKNFKALPLPLIVVGTTAGTGSEVSAGAVLTVDRTGKKSSVVHPLCYPGIALSDSKYTYNIPRNITISTALDAFAHATEGWFSRKRNTVSCAFAKEALPPIWKTLVLLSEGKELTHKQRDDIYYAALLAGMVLAIGTTYPHGLGYVLTENYGVPHGQACAVFDRHLIKWSKKYAPEIAEEFFTILDANENEVDCVLNKLIDLGQDIKMSDAEIKEISSRWNDNISKFTNVYGKFTVKTAEQLLKELFGE